MRVGTGDQAWSPAAVEQAPESCPFAGERWAGCARALTRTVTHTRIDRLQPCVRRVAGVRDAYASRELHTRSSMIGPDRGASPRTDSWRLATPPPHDHALPAHPVILPGLEVAREITARASLPVIAAIRGAQRRTPCVEPDRFPASTRAAVAARGRDGDGAESSPVNPARQRRAVRSAPWGTRRIVIIGLHVRKTASARHRGPSMNGLRSRVRHEISGQSVCTPDWRGVGTTWSATAAKMVGPDRRIAGRKPIMTIEGSQTGSTI